MDWTPSEKKIARRVFEMALAEELAEVMAEFKRRAAAAAEPADLWAIEDDLRRTRRDIDGKYDFRYSQLILLFGGLLRAGRIAEAQLAGLSEEKLAAIRRVASM